MPTDYLTHQVSWDPAYITYNNHVWTKRLDAKSSRFPKNKTYVITGANSGTGYEASRIFLSKGANVVMLNRNPDKSAEAIRNLEEEFSDAASRITFIQMDLSDLESVRRAS